MSKQSFTTGQVLTAAQVNSLQANDYNQTVSVKTASYVLVAADKGTRIEFNTSGSVTCTVNSGLFDAGDTLVIQNRGAGTATVTAGTATVNTGGSLVVNQYESGTLYFISASAALWFGSNPGDITAVTAGTGISGGGTSGAVTITNSMATEITAKGDLIVGTGNATFDNLPVGTNGYTLVADSAQSTGLKWAAPAGGGKVLQVVSATSTTGTTITSTSFTDANLSATITPTLNTSKILVLFTVTVFASRSSSSNTNDAQILRNSTVVTDFGNQSFFHAIGAAGATIVEKHDVKAFHYLDSPSSTSALTYKLQGRVSTTANSNTLIFQPNSSVSSIILMEIGA